MRNFYLTKKGLERIKKEYEGLRRIRVLRTKEESPQIFHSAAINLEYLVFQEDLNFLETRLAELENILKNFELIKIPPKERRNVVNLGATVTLQEGNGRLFNFTIVGTLEADPNEGKISLNSPIGKVLLGRKTGEKVVITFPTKAVYQIKRIRYKTL